MLLAATKVADGLTHLSRHLVSVMQCLSQKALQADGGWHYVCPYISSIALRLATSIPRHMSIFSSEATMQQWLSRALESAEGLSELITNLSEIEEHQATNFAESRILKSFTTCIESLHINEIVFENKDISITKGEGLKPDFVLYAAETQSVVIVELKNISGPTRNAGTELSAYSCEVKSLIPFLSDGDLVHVLISMEWPTLLKHYVRHEIIWQSKNLICLQPVEGTNGEIKLRILPIGMLAEDVRSFKIGQEYLGGFQVCLYDDGLCTANANRKRLDQHVEQFKSALHSMAVIGNRLNSHGFAFLWKDHSELSGAPYSITLLNFAPFQSVERFLHIDGVNGINDLPDTVGRFMRLVRDHDPEGHGNTLSKITDACTELLESICSPRVEGFTHWGALRKIMDGRAEHIAFVGWGLFGELHIEKLKEAYKNGDFVVPSTDPSLGFSVVAEIVDDDYQFIDMSYIEFPDEDDADDANENLLDDDVRSLLNM